MAKKIASGLLRKMQTTLTLPVSYQLQLDDTLALNPLLGQTLQICATGHIECVQCGTKIKKTYQQGYCFPCTQKLAACDLCILKPERCHFHLGTCREPEWGQQHCMVPHIVYLANTSGLKIGITRESQVPTRWIDQGAVQALPIAKVQSRYQSGLLEILFAEHIADKTHWQRMLKGNIAPIDLAQARDRLLPQLADGIGQVAAKFEWGDIELLTSEDVVDIDYPVTEYPTKVKSFNLAKVPEITATLQGIKGQYLIFDTGVFNCRNHSGHEVTVGLG